MARCQCGHSSSFRREGRLYFQCTSCRYQCSVISGTTFEASKLWLSRWFLAIHLLTFLQADGCEYLTGQNIAIDGGHHLAAPSTFAALGKLTPEDWAEAKAIVRSRAEKEKSQRSTG